MKILNLYAGIGGNRKLWTQNVGYDQHSFPSRYNITAIEINPDIAAIYKEKFPNDNVIVGDAHQYLLENYKEFDFIWSSPPCPTHSDIRRCGVHRGLFKAKYPDMLLYEEIILLKHFALKTTKYVVENVIPYYKPLLSAQKIQRHLFWTNFFIRPLYIKKEVKHENISGSDSVYGFNLKGYKIKEKQKILRNLVNPKLGRHILECSQDEELTMKLF